MAEPGEKMRKLPKFERIRATGERNDEEGYSSLWVTITFEEAMPYELAEFFYDYLNKHAQKSKGYPCEYQEVSFMAMSLNEKPEDENKILGIDFYAGNTEYNYFEEYFEGEEFRELIETGLKQFFGIKEPDKNQSKLVLGE